MEEGLRGNMGSQEDSVRWRGGSCAISSRKRKKVGGINFLRGGRRGELEHRAYPKVRTRYK